MIIESLPRLRWGNLSQYTDTRPSTLITSTSGENRIKPYLVGVDIIENRHIATAQSQEVDTFISQLPATDVIYAAGGGLVIDVGRLAASEWNKEFIAIPTAITTDSFLVNSTGVRENSCVKYIPSKKASVILFDIELLHHAPQHMNTSGCSDVLSIETALNDWKLANDRGVAQPDEQFDPAVAKIAKAIVDSLFENTNEIKQMSNIGIQTIINGLAMEVQLCYLYGNSRPEEGGEHFFTYNLETRVPHTLHGEMVGLGTLITLFIQDKPWRHIQSFMDTVKLQYHPDGISKSTILETLKDMQSYVTNNNLRYSIYNEFSFAKEEARIAAFLTNNLHII